MTDRPLPTCPECLEDVPLSKAATSSILAELVARGMHQRQRGKSLHPEMIALQARAELAETKAALDGAYTERNRLVAFLARQYRSGTRRTAIEGWDPCWHGCVFVDTPEGQMSWHYHDRDSWLFSGLPPYSETWDGHTTIQKYARLATLCGCSEKGASDADAGRPAGVCVGTGRTSPERHQVIAAAALVFAGLALILLSECVK